MQRINIRQNNCVIRWIEIYPVDGVIRHLNNWAITVTKFSNLIDWLYMDSPDFSNDTAVRIMPKYLDGTRHRVRN